MSYTLPDFLTSKKEPFMECVVGPPVSGDNLFGRENELKDIWERLESGNHLLMTAPRRVGKTSLMMELKRQPQPGWTVVYVDVEACADAQSCITEIVDELLRRPEFKKHFQWTQRWESFHNILERVDFQVRSVRARLEPRANRSWIKFADRVLTDMRKMANEDFKLLIIIDELPIAIARMATGTNGANEANLFLSWYRKMRQTPQLQGKVGTLVGGSIGLHGIVHRLNASKQINDFSLFPLDSWSMTTAAQFLQQIGTSQGFSIQNQYIEEMLNLLEDPIPYHVQLFYLELRKACSNDSNAISREAVQQCFWNHVVEKNKDALVAQLLEKLSYIFDDQDITSAQKILDALSQNQQGVSLVVLADQTERRLEEVRRIASDLKNEGDVVLIDDRARFRSGLVRASWTEHNKRRIR